MLESQPMRAMISILAAGICLVSALLLLQEAPVFSAIGQESKIEDRPDAQPSGGQGEGVLRLEGALIRSFRQAAISAQVSGRIMARRFDAGEHVNEEEVVFELFPQDYELALTRARELLLRMKVSQDKWQAELNILNELIRHEAATRQQVLEAEAETQIALRRAKEAEIGLKQAELNFQRCKVQAPFAGYITQIFREPFESIQQGDQLFMIADISKVYAVVNMRWDAAQKISRGSAAQFISPGGGKFRGTVDRIEKPIDPSSQTKRIHVLIDNNKEALQMGMLGTLEFHVKK